MVVNFGMEITMGKKFKIPRGHVPMLVGTGKEMQRFQVPTKLLKHPYMALLLELAAEEFGYEQRGILRIPCDPKIFQREINAVAKAKL